MGRHPEADLSKRASIGRGTPTSRGADFARRSTPQSPGCGASLGPLAARDCARRGPVVAHEGAPPVVDDRRHVVKAAWQLLKLMAPGRDPPRENGAAALLTSRAPHGSTSEERGTAQDGTFGMVDSTGDFRKPR